ncbi:MAG TPA: hypothetical protein PKD64_15990 [Pirellulaceae bacterium]|nr:hypothetical protein [Pirellulaceae bacterium]HMO93689.1 hypothetical protein [Pirellulaceae bacterium]
MFFSLSANWVLASVMQTEELVVLGVQANCSETVGNLPDRIELMTLNQGTLAGLVVSEGLNAWNFKIAGSPKSDPGLRFERIK